MVNIPKTCGLKNDEDYYNNEEVYFDAMQDGILDHIEQKLNRQSNHHPTLEHHHETGMVARYKSSKVANYINVT